MKNIGRCGDTKQKKLRCLECGKPIETQTIVRTGSGAAILSAAPGELTRCEHCSLMIEYGGRPGALRVQRARQERVRAFREFEQERPDHIEVPALVEYVMRFRTMPAQMADQTSGTIRFKVFLHS